VLRCIHNSIPELTEHLSSSDRNPALRLNTGGLKPRLLTRCHLIRFYYLAVYTSDQPEAAATSPPAQHTSLSTYMARAQREYILRNVRLDNIHYSSFDCDGVGNLLAPTCILPVDKTGMERPRTTWQISPLSCQCPRRTLTYNLAHLPSGISQ